jgi:hypothetical protein
MKPFFSVLAIAALAGVVLCCVLLLAGTAQTESGSKHSQIDQDVFPTYEYPALPAPGEPKPSVEVSETVYDFGLMDVMTEGEHEFVIRNGGEGPLVLKQGETTCSCTISTVQSGGVVPPGGEATIKLAWETQAGHIEDYRQTAVILTNDADNRTVKLVIKGTVRSFLLVVPPIWNMSEVSVFDLPVKQLFVMGSASPKPFEITKIESSIPDYLSYGEIKPASEESLDRIRTLSDYSDLENVWEVELTLNPGMPMGRFRESVVFHTNITRDDKEGNPVTLDPFELRVYGRITGDINFQGRDFEQQRWVLKFGNVPSATGKSGKLYMYTRGQVVNPRVKLVEPDLLQVTIAEQTQGIYELDVTVPPGTAPCNYMGMADKEGNAQIGRIILETDHPVEKELLVLVQFAVQQNY